MHKVLFKEIQWYSSNRLDKEVFHDYKYEAFFIFSNNFNISLILKIYYKKSHFIKIIQNIIKFF